MSRVPGLAATLLIGLAVGALLTVGLGGGGLRVPESLQVALIGFLGGAGGAAIGAVTASRIAAESLADARAAREQDRADARAARAAELAEARAARFLDVRRERYGAFLASVEEFLDQSESQHAVAQAVARGEIIPAEIPRLESPEPIRRMVTEIRLLAASDEVGRRANEAYGDLVMLFAGHEVDSSHPMLTQWLDDTAEDYEDSLAHAEQALSVFLEAAKRDLGTG